MKIEWTIAVLAAVAPSVCAQSLATTPDSDEKVVSTTLEDIRSTPDAYKGVWVTFPIQFCSIGKVSNPFFTQFVPTEFANFYAWGVGQQIWQKPEYDNVFGTLFISKQNEQLNDVYRLELYERINVVGIVRNVFQSRPWIEIISFEELPGRVTTPTLAHLYRAELNMQRRQWNRAVSELTLASAGEIPEDVLASVHQNLGTCFLRVGEAEKALNHLGIAVRLFGENVPSKLARMWSVAKQNPELQLDRELESVEIEDYERPMWEAFAVATAGN